MQLSIAIPTFRRPAMLAECLDSLVTQLVDGMEVLAVDNDPAASARTTVEGYRHPAIRYLHEPKPGVVQARNRAVRDSRGAYLGFIDDDEIARPGWVAALLRHAEMGVDASFGMVVPRYLGSVPAGLEALVDDLYTRDLKRPQDADITDTWIHVGTGNSLFNKRVCFKDDAPFSAKLNGTGGEDVFLVRTLVERGLQLRWNPQAVVDEQVPADRSTLAYVASRKFRHGQQRIIMMRGEGGAKGAARAALWMGVGAAQLGLHGGRSWLLKAAGRPRWRAERVRAQGGLGKLLWWKMWENTPYAGGTASS